MNSITGGLEIKTPHAHCRCMEQNCANNHYSDCKICGVLQTIPQQSCETVVKPVELLVDESKVGDVLTAKQEAFCRYYTQVMATFGNATLSYAEAYGYDLDNARKDDYVVEKDEKTGENRVVEPSTYTKFENICASSGSRLLRNVKVDKRVRDLLVEMMDDKVIDARLIEIIMNGKDQDAINAIKEFNKLRQRIIEKKDITSGGEKITGFEFVRATPNNDLAVAPLPSPTFLEITATNEEDSSPNQTDL